MDVLFVIEIRWAAFVSICRGAKRAFDPSEIGTESQKVLENLKSAS